MFSRLRILIAVVVIGVSTVSLSGCFDSPRQKLIGKWVMTFEMTQSDLSQMSPTENPLAASFAQLLMKTVQGEMTMDFRNNDALQITMAFLGNQFERPARWRVLESNGNTAKLEVSFAEGGEAAEWNITFIDENAFQTTPPPSAKWAGTKLVTFKRAAN